MDAISTTVKYSEDLESIGNLSKIILEQTAASSTSIPLTSSSSTTGTTGNVHDTLESLNILSNAILEQTTIIPMDHVTSTTTKISVDTSKKVTKNTTSEGEVPDVIESFNFLSNTILKQVAEPSKMIPKDNLTSSKINSKTTTAPTTTKKTTMTAVKLPDIFGSFNILSNNILEEGKAYTRMKEKDNTISSTKIPTPAPSMNKNLTTVP